MAITKETIQRLVAVQQQDSVLDGLQKESDRIPREIADLQAGLDGAKAKLAEAKAKVVGFEKKKKEKELELASKEEAIRKHSMELNQVKTNDAFKALQHQIDDAKAAGSQIETDILEVMEGIDAGKKEEGAAAGTPCRISLAPQMIVEVTKAKALVVCESCQRILYKPEPAAKAA